jgi:hypothetical protein
LVKHGASVYSPESGFVQRRGHGEKPEPQNFEQMNIESRTVCTSKFGVHLFGIHDSIDPQPMLADPVSAARS